MSGTILIYGGSGGIGSATARRLVSRGYQCHLVARDEERLRQVATETGSSFSVADVTDPASFEQVAATIAQPLAGLIYAVGTINLKPLTRLTMADFDTDFQINARGAALAVQVALPALQAANAASILLFSSVAVSQGFTAHASIAMAKGAVEGLTRSLAAELVPKIRVNCIAPSLTRTPLANRLTSSASMSTAIAQMHPLQRLGEADDLAALAAFLMSEESSWITGQVIGVDGGRSTLRVKG